MVKKERGERYKNKILLDIFQKCETSYITIYVHIYSLSREQYKYYTYKYKLELTKKNYF